LGSAAELFSGLEVLGQFRGLALDIKNLISIHSNI